MQQRLVDRSCNSAGRRIGRYLMAGVLLLGAAAHLSFARHEFSALVPDWIPLNKDFVVVATGYMELALGLALNILPKYKRSVGWIIAVYLLLIFAGNIFQFTEHKNAFGLDSDLKRSIRLLFQPPLILLALWSAGAWCQRADDAPRD